MSSKKISTTVAISQEIYALLEKQRTYQQRSFGFIVEEALRNYYKMPREGEGVKANAD